jgi:hypothetical protein
MSSKVAIHNRSTVSLLLTNGILFANRKNWRATLAFMSYNIDMKVAQVNMSRADDVNLP